MPYPFMQFPTFGEVREHLENKYQCRYENDGLDSYFWRKLAGGKVVFCEFIEAEDNDRLHTENIRHICNRLYISPEEFGLTLG